MSETQTAVTPRHLWIVGIVGLLWNLGGAYDYIMTQTRNAGYLEQFTPEQLEMFEGFPAWLVACWAIAVWGGLLGTVLLLMRRKLAVTAFVTSFVCVVITVVQNYGFANAMEINGPAGHSITVIVFVVALLLLFYSRRMTARGVLR